jgi:hypothetical protein
MLCVLWLVLMAGYVCVAKRRDIDESLPPTAQEANIACVIVWAYRMLVFPLTVASFLFAFLTAYTNNLRLLPFSTFSDTLNSGSLLLIMAVLSCILAV